MEEKKRVNEIGDLDELRPYTLDLEEDVLEENYYASLSTIGKMRGYILYRLKEKKIISISSMEKGPEKLKAYLDSYLPVILAMDPKIFARSDINITDIPATLKSLYLIKGEDLYIEACHCICMALDALIRPTTVLAPKDNDCFSPKFIEILFNGYLILFKEILKGNFKI